MTNPLALAADLLSRAAALWPDAPGLPQYYHIDEYSVMHCCVIGQKPLPTFAAEAVVMRVVMDLLKWWEKQHPNRYVHVWASPECVGYTSEVDWDVEGPADTALSEHDDPTLAHLAALRAIVEQGEAKA